MFKHVCRFLSVSLATALVVGCTGQTFAPVSPLADRFAPSAQTQVADVSVEMTETIRNEVIVKYKEGFATQAAQQIPGTQVLDGFTTNQVSTQLVHLPEKTSLEAALKTYQADPAVEFALPNVRFDVQMSLPQSISNWWNGKKTQVLPSEGQTNTEETDPQPSPSPSDSGQEELSDPPAQQSTGPDPLEDQQWYLSRMDMPQVWSEHGTGTSGVTVAVLDTGVDYTHPDLAGRVIKGADYVDRDYEPLDEHGHGTHVAGIIAAGLNNAIGVAGVAPNVHILAVRVLDKNGSGNLFNIAKGIAYAANQGAKVINLSLGSPPGGSIMKTLANFLAKYAEYKGALIVAAAGNSGGAIGYPAAASHFLSVGALNEDNYLASFSNRGAELDVVAPGVNILSTFPTYDVTTNALGLPHNYATLNGTSMATPMVSALAALVWSQNPYLTPEEVRARIESSAIDLGPIGRDDMFGMGMINPEGALAAVVSGNGD